jgi:hypothetical protein
MSAQDTDDNCPLYLWLYDGEPCKLSEGEMEKEAKTGQGRVEGVLSERVIGFSVAVLEVAQWLRSTVRNLTPGASD